MVPSANKINFNIIDTLHMSFISRINNYGPNYDPCGTP